jgi:hypothetical protein
MAIVDLSDPATVAERRRGPPPSAAELAIREQQVHPPYPRPASVHAGDTEP